MPMYADSGRIYFTESGTGRIKFDTEARVAHITNSAAGYIVTPDAIPITTVEEWGGGGGENDSAFYRYSGSYTAKYPLFSISPGDTGSPLGIMYSFIEIGGGNADTGGLTMSMMGGSVIARVLRSQQYYVGSVIVDIIEDYESNHVVLQTRSSVSTIPDGFGFDGNWLTGLAVGVTYRVYRGKYR